MQLLPDQTPVVEAHLLRLGWMREGERLAALSSPGDGNMNRVLRADLGERSLILKQSVPFVARYPDIAAPVERLDVEAAFYRATEADETLRAQMPAMRGYDPDNHLLCFEDLGMSADCTDVYSSDAPLPTTELLGWLSHLHQLKPVADPVFENRAMRTLNHAHIFEIPLQAADGPGLPPALDDVRRRFSNDAPLCRQAADLGRLYLGTRPAGRPVLLHGDFYPGSWLRREDAPVAVIDPEFAFLGPAEFDVGVFMGHLTLAGWPVEEIPALLEAYSASADFSMALTQRFAGMEIIRRLLGVAQLPLAADISTRCRLLERARVWVTQ